MDAGANLLVCRALRLDLHVALSARDDNAAGEGEGEGEGGIGETGRGRQRTFCRRLRIAELDASTSGVASG